MRMVSKSSGTQPAGVTAAGPAMPATYRSTFRLKRRGRKYSWLRGIAWTLCTLVAMAGTADVLLHPPAFLLTPPQTASNEAPGWTDIRNPIPVFAFSGGQFDRPASQYTARRHANGSRIDTMTYGEFAGTKNGNHDWMRIRLHRTKADASSPGFFVDMARLAAIDGLAVTRHSFPNIVKTRFGEFAVSDLEISTGKTKAACLGYRMQLNKPAFKVSGIACGAAHAPIDRRLLTCIINRLDVLSARDDRELSGFFARSELKRNENCVKSKIAMRKRSAWLDQIKPAEAVSALRLVSLPAGQTRR